MDDNVLQRPTAAQLGSARVTVRSRSVMIRVMLRVRVTFRVIISARVEIGPGFSLRPWLYN